MSYLLSFGNIILFICLYYAANILFCIPPTGNIIPVNVISPVKAKFFFIYWLNIREKIAAHNVMPAEGPSLGIPFSLKCT